MASLLSLCGEGGCAAKLPAQELEKLLEGVSWHTTPEVLVGLETGDDAGVYLLNEDSGLILTTDFFPPFCDDAFLYGRVAAANALSDIYAMGGQPLAALNLTLFPTEEELRPLLREILEGGSHTAKEAGIPIIGGHTIANPTPVYGWAVLGQVAPERLVRNTGLEEGQDLVLTKPLGTGVAMVAARLMEKQSLTYAVATTSMCLLNAAAVPIMHRYGVHTATDITGFSLMGHAYKMARASEVTITFNARMLPFFPAVPVFIEDGYIPGAAFTNQRSVETYCRIDGGVPYWLRTLVYDPQTSGGLLMAVDPKHTASLISDLRGAGYFAATSVGRVLPLSEEAAVVLEYQ